MKKLIKWVATAVVLAATLAVPAQAQALYLGKYEARRVVVPEVKGLYNDVDWAVDWWVEPAYRCDRLSYRSVECDYELYDDDGMTCESTVRIIEKARAYAIRYPYEPDCY